MNSFNTSIGAVLLIAIVAFSARGKLSAQTKSHPSGINQLLSANTSCYDETGKLIGSRISRTPVLVSPDGSFRAYAQSSAVAAESPDKPECHNTSKLFIAGKGQNFHSVLTIEPSGEALGNNVEIIDWSPRRHRILLAQGFWQYGSGVGGTLVRIYDADSDNLSSESLVDDAFSRFAGKRCAIILRPLGFSRNGDAIVRAAPYFNYGEDKAAEDSCVQKRGIWLVNGRKEWRNRLAGGYPPQRFGRIAP